MFKINEMENYSNLDSLEGERNLSFVITESKLSCIGGGSAYNGMFYILHGSGDFRLKGLIVDTDVQEEQSSYYCKFPHTVEGIVEAIKCRAELEGILNITLANGKCNSVYNDNRSFKEATVEVRSNTIGNDLIVDKKERIFVNGVEVFNVRTFIEEYLYKSLSGTGFRVFVKGVPKASTKYTIENSPKRVEITTTHGGFKLDVITPYSVKTFNDVNKENIVEHGLLCCEYVRNYIVNNLRNTKEEVKTYTI